MAVPGSVVNVGKLVTPGGQQGPQGIQGLPGEGAPIGSIFPFPSTTAPPTFMLCDGSAISRAGYPVLFGIIGTAFGVGDGATTFSLPDLRGRVGVGAGQGASLTNRVLAAKGGEETHQLTIAELASHSHQLSYTSFTVAAGGGSANSIPGGSLMNTYGTTGSDVPHNNMPPFVVVAYIIKVSSGGGATAQAPLADATQDGLLRKVSGLSTDYVGGDNVCHSLVSNTINIAFITKTAAYTLTAGDNAKYVICSGGSWTLTLPIPAVGLNYRLRNDMGITGTTGTITVAPNGGTINGLSSLALLPQQECTLVTDGSNWRTFGLKREVILGTQDITSSTAFGSVLLPVGFRYFELEFYGFLPVTTPNYLVGQLSVNGGSTWVSSSLYHGTFYNGSISTAAFFDSENGTSFYIIPNTVGSYSESRLVIHPGTATTQPVWHVDGVAWSANVQKWNDGGFYNVNGAINALKYFPNTGNISQCYLTVKGVV